MYTFIENIEDLAFLNDELINKSYVAIDTEFRRTSKDNMKLALMQVNDGEEIYLIDTVQIKEPKNAANFLFSKDVLKILHSCKEDLEAIFSWSNQKMENIFDTQLANSFLENEYSISYQGLVEKKLGIILNKKETRSNWLKRPLSDDQLKYAALDVEYLIPLYLEQKELLRSSGKNYWHDEDIQKLVSNTFENQMSENNIRRSIPREQENELLYKLNLKVNEIAKQERINPTLFFSKKAQKDLLRIALLEGADPAFREITPWRKKLLKISLEININLDFLPVNLLLLAVFINSV